MWSSLSSVLKALSSVIFFMAAVAGVISCYFVWRQFSQTPPVGANGPSSSVSDARSTTDPGLDRSISDAPRTGSTRPASPTAWTIGRCLRANETPTRCDGPHDGEVFGAGVDCNRNQFLTYAGGNPKLEILSSSLTYRPTVDGTACKVVGLSAIDLSSSTRNILGNGSGDALRRCLDGPDKKEVACSTPHTREYVFLGPTTESVDVACNSKADVYIGSLSEDTLKQIRILQGTLGADTYCAVEVRGANVLTGSLRSLGDTALPLAPRLRD